jgi:dihydroorotase
LRVGKHLAAGDHTFDAGNMIAVPGLTDWHAHIASGVVDLCIEPDELIQRGDCIAVDAGSVGYENFPQARVVYDRAKLRCYAYLHLNPIGEAVLPERDYIRLDEEKFIRVVEGNRDVIKGVKLRLVEGALMEGAYDVIARGVELAHRLNIRVMTHIGEHHPEALEKARFDEAFARLCSMLRAGDILTHAYTHGAGGPFAGGNLQALKGAVARGIWIDSGNGRGHFDFNNAKQAATLGIFPQLLGTDTVKFHSEQPHFYAVPMIISKWLAVGMPLTQALAAASSNAHIALGISGEYGFAEGRRADISFIKRSRGIKLFHDGGAGHLITGTTQFTAQAVLQGGELFAVKREYAKDNCSPILFLRAMKAQR